ncbi:unnamed protein product [Clavelina lepadiformis]|uniref:1-phosphatidylinositol-3-phosphate 5-kinase n=1 Tax=Clavelina lepadiformis TaxID=159417 RepID=A0ABP0EYS3_CLALP
MPVEEINTRNDSLTFFKPLKEDNALRRSSVLQSMIGFFSSKKDGQGGHKTESLQRSKSSSNVPSTDNIVAAKNIVKVAEGPVTTTQHVNKEPSHSHSSSSLKNMLASRPSSLNMAATYKGREKETVQGSEVEVRLRHFSTMFRDIPRIITGNNQNDKESGESYQEQSLEPDLRQYWMPDEQCHVCYECGGRFTTFRRRHHCRICGHIFCSRCCNELLPGRIIGYAGMVRSCKYCCSLVASYTRNPRSSTLPLSEADASSEVNYATNAAGGSMPLDQVNSSVMKSQVRISRSKSLVSMKGSPVDEQPSMLSVTSPVPYDVGNWISAYDMFDATPGVVNNLENAYENDPKLLAKDSIQLGELWNKITDEKDGAEFRDHRFRLRKFPQSIIATELVDWLISHNMAAGRDQACAIGQALLDAEWIKPVIDDRDLVFQDEYCLYQHGSAASTNLLQKPYFEVSGDTVKFNRPQKNKSSRRTKLLFSDVSLDNEPNWVREITIEEEDSLPSIDDEIAFWPLEKNDKSNFRPISNAGTNFFNEEACSSPQSVMSLSSFVEIDNEHFTIKYNKSSSRDVEGLRKSSSLHQPRLTDDSVTDISADYIRAYLIWNDTYLRNSLSTSYLGWRESDLYSSSLSSQTKHNFTRLQKHYFSYSIRFLRQLLQAEQLDMAWADIVVPLAKRICETVVPNCDINMDICHYVHIKKLLDGPRQESRLVSGVVFSNNVIDGQMKTHIENPVIMLLATPLEYQRVQYKLASIDPIVRQEPDFFKHLVSRIAARQPDLVISQCSVSHEARRLLHKAGITLVINVKPAVMERISRCTSADIACSIDQLQNVRLGCCGRFRIHHHYNGKRKFHCGDGILWQKAQEYGEDKTKSYKSLIYLDGCNLSHGCTLLLRGFPDYKVQKDIADSLMRECLTRVKMVLFFLIRIMYHSNLEMSYLMDQQDLANTLASISSNEAMDSQATPSKAPLKKSNERLEYPNDSSNSLQEDGRVLQYEQVSEITPTDILDKDHSKTFARSHSVPPGTSTSIRSHSQAFKKYFFQTLLSITPLTAPTLPYLLTEEGGSSPLLAYLSSPLYWSNLFWEGFDHGVVSSSWSEQSCHPSATDYTVDEREISSIRSRSVTSETFALSPHSSKNTQHNRLCESGVLNLPHTHSETSSFQTLEKLKVNASDQNIKVGVQRQETSYHLPSTGYRRLMSQASVKSIVIMDDFLSSGEKTTMCEILGHSNEEDGVKLQQQSNHLLSSTSEDARSNPKLGDVRKRRYEAPQLNSLDETDRESTYWKTEKHDFITAAFTKPAYSKDVKDLLADYRASGSSLLRLKSGPSWTKTLTETSPWQSLCYEKGSLVEEEEEEADFPVDCLTPHHHQHIFVLFTSYSLQSPNSPYPCVMPWAVNIDYYRGNDITLGGFLDRYCFRPNYHCPSSSCKRPMVDHVRSFVHGSTCINIILKELSKPVETPNVLSWCWNPVTKTSTDIQILSDDASSMSFAKFLELRLQANNICGVEPTSDSNSEDVLVLPPFTSFQYFLFRDIVASFKCYQICVYDITMPPFSITFDEVVDWRKTSSINNGIANTQFSSEYKECVDTMNKLSKIGYEALDSIYDMIVAARSSNPLESSSGSEQTDMAVDTAKFCNLRECHFEKLLSLYHDERCQLRDAVDNIHLKLQSIRKEQLAHDEKGAATDSSVVVDSNAQSATTFINKSDINPILPDMNASNGFVTFDEESRSEISLLLLKLTCLVCQLVHEWNNRINNVTDQDKNYRKGSKVAGMPYFTEATSILSTVSTSNEPETKVLVNFQAQQEGLLEPDLKGVGDEVVALRQAEDENEDAQLALPDLFASDIVQSVTGPRDAFLKEKANTPTASLQRSSERLTNVGASTKRFSRTTSSMRVRSFFVNHLMSSSNYMQVPSPFPPDEHYLLADCVSSQIVVRDAEPSSIIAYTLCTKDYQHYLELDTQTASFEDNVDKSSKTAKKQLTAPSSAQLKNVSTELIKENQVFGKDELDGSFKIGFRGSRNSKQLDSKSTSTSPRHSHVNDSSQTSLLPPSPHIEVQFGDTSTKFYCKVYFAAEFKALREQILGGSEQAYIRSLSRCKRWVARGGKSGSAFHKTLDNRFILKQMSRFEVQSFLELARSYLTYVSDAMKNKSPTTLSKILGVYRVSFHNSSTNRTFKQDVLVMENLFYKRNITQVFDLKGSVRNRHVKTDADNSTSFTTSPNVTASSETLHSAAKDQSLLGQNDLVLLDENLLSIMRDHPLYVHEHTKILIQKALSDDAHFLSSHLVIDYSLLVGIDSDKKELVVGIIDYMRTFTWDKKLEMVVKSYGMIGRQGTRSMPTVVSPDLYRTRFCEAMERYFQVVPDRWFQMHAYHV